jgi:hypothetical protein
MDWELIIAGLSVGLAFISTVLVFYTVKYLKLQNVENQKIRDSAVLKEIYNDIRRTHKDRVLIYDKRELIRNVDTVEKFKNFKIDNRNIYDSIREVENVYHYIGFFIKFGILHDKNTFFEEGGETLLGVNNRIASILNIERELLGNDYMQYFDFLVSEVKNYQERKLEDKF